MRSINCKGILQKYSQWCLSLLVAIAFSTWFGSAWGHDAPSGWSYPLNCCSGYDCREVPEQAVSEQREGYEIIRTGEIIGYSDTRLKNSPDGHYHWCSNGGSDTGHTICLFVPPQSF